MDMTKDETSNGSDLLKLFANRFLHLLENDMDCDCEFIVGSQNTVIRGHKFLFSAASEVFYAMFHGDLQEKNAVQVEDLDAEGFEGMKQFIYTGEVEFTSALQALLIYIAARKYMIAFLSQQCVTFINKENSIQPSEVLEFYELCKLHNIPQFEKQCYEIIQQKTDEVIDSEFFVSAAPETIEIILKSPYLNLKSEVDVIHLFERWVKAGAESKGIGVGKMMSTGNINYLKKHIRFLTISSDEFVRDVLGSLILTAEEKIAVACNLKTSDTKPMPESLSLERQTREFIKFQYISIFEPKIYSRNHKFVVSINNPTNTCNEYDIKFNDGDISNKISYIKFKQYICFQLETETKKLYENSEHVMKFGFKLTMSTENECKKKIIILHQNDVFVILKWTSLHTQKIVFATIPISKLKSLNSLKVNDDNVIIIHCSFNIKYLE